MGTELDFEQAWLTKFSRCLEQFAGNRIRDEVMAGSEELSSQSSRQDVIAWTQSAIDRLDSRLPDGAKREIMMGCACRYSTPELDDIRDAYETSGDVGVAHRMLQTRFEALLRDSLHLDEDLIQEVVDRGWGLAGVQNGNTILATKIPKSGLLEQYMAETDPARKRQLYCHCPRIRDALGSGDEISATYCYCGAGYYRGIWDHIAQQPVEIELLKSVMKGDDVCSFRIKVPERRGDGQG